MAEGHGGRFLSVTGTKLTCFRSLAEGVGDAVVRRVRRGGPSLTADIALDGSDEETGALEARAMLDLTEAVRATGLEPAQIEALVATYGRRVRAVLDLARRLPGGLERICKSAPEIVAQVNWAVETELAVSLQDVLLRRTGIGTGPCLGLDCARLTERRRTHARRISTTLGDATNPDLVASLRQLYLRPDANGRLEVMPMSSMPLATWTFADP